MSKALKGENNPMFGRTGENHPMFGKAHSEETKAKISAANGSKVQVINKETDETIIYPSNYKAAEALSTSETTIRNYIKNKKLYKGKYLFLKYSVQ
jgi:group I intron endonuclease